MRKTLKTLFALGMLSIPAVGEVDEYRIGHLVEGVFDVLGFNFLDLTSALPTLFILGLAMVVFFAGRKLWKRR